MSNLKKLRTILMSNDVVDALHSEERKIFRIIPELEDSKGFEQKNEWHCFDVWDHTIHATASCDRVFNDRLILLLHDIGKPFCYQDYGNVRHFKGHAKKSAEMSKIILQRLLIEQHIMERMLFLIRNHSTPIDEVEFENDELLYNELLKIQMCDASAYEPEHAKQTLIRLRAKKNYSIIQY